MSARLLSRGEELMRDAVLYLRNLAENVTSAFFLSPRRRTLLTPRSGRLPRLGTPLLSLRQPALISRTAHDPPLWTQQAALPLLLFRLGSGSIHLPPHRHRLARHLGHRARIVVPCASSHLVLLQARRDECALVSLLKIDVTLMLFLQIGLDEFREHVSAELERGGRR